MRELRAGDHGMRAGLVEREADEQGQRVRGDQGIGLVGVGEVEPVGHGSIVARRAAWDRCECKGGEM